LDVADRIETEPARNAGFDQRDDATNRGFGIIRLDEIKVAVGLGLSQIGDRSIVDAVGTHDDLALGRKLATYFALR
jgi:hypothetical protein